MAKNSGFMPGMEEVSGVRTPDGKVYGVAGITPVKAFRTPDGTVHSDFGQAVRHMAMSALSEAAEEASVGRGGNWDTDMILGWIAEEAATVATSALMLANRADTRVLNAMRTMLRLYQEDLEAINRALPRGDFEPDQVAIGKKRRSLADRVHLLGYTIQELEELEAELGKKEG